MRVRISRHNRYWVLTCSGTTAGLLPGPVPEVISAVKGGAEHLVLNLAELKYINPIGVKAIIDSIDFAKKYGANLAIAEPNSYVRRILRLNWQGAKTPFYRTQLEAMARMVDKIDIITSSTDLYDKLLIAQYELKIALEIRNACASHPQKPKFRLKPVRDLSEALSSIRTEKVDCVLVDSGFRLYQVAGFLEDYQQEELPEIPIVVISPDRDLNIADRMVRHGATDVLRYPFHPSEVVIRLQSLISQYKWKNEFVPPEKIINPFGAR